MWHIRFLHPFQLKSYRQFGLIVKRTSGVTTQNEDIGNFFYEATQRELAIVMI